MAGKITWYGQDFDEIGDIDAEYMRLGLKPGVQPPHLRPGHAAPEGRRLMDEDILQVAANAARMN